MPGRLWEVDPGALAQLIFHQLLQHSTLMIKLLVRKFAKTYCTDSNMLALIPKRAQLQAAPRRDGVTSQLSTWNAMSMGNKWTGANKSTAAAAAAAAVHWCST